MEPGAGASTRPSGGRVWRFADEPPAATATARDGRERGEAPGRWGGNAPRWGWPATLAIGFTLAAGALHFVVAPDHFAHEKSHGIFFAGLGAVQVVLAVALARQPTRMLLALSVLLAGMSIVLYVLATTYRAPFHTHEEDRDFFGLFDKGLEACALVFSCVALAVLPEAKGRPARATLAIVGLVVLSGALGVAAYAGGIASEPLFPWLDEPGADDPMEHMDHPPMTPSSSPPTSHPHGG